MTPTSETDSRAARRRWRRVPVVDRSDRHHHLRRKADLLHLRSIGGIRTQPHPRTHQPRTGSGTRPRATRWPTTGDVRDANQTSEANAHRRNVTHRHPRSARSVAIDAVPALEIAHRQSPFLAHGPPGRCESTSEAATVGVSGTSTTLKIDGRMISHENSSASIPS